MTAAQRGRSYGQKSKQKVKKAMQERKQGTLTSGRSGKKVTSRKQAIAIGLSEARKEGGKVPKKSKAKRAATSGASKSKARPTSSRPTKARSTLKRTTRKPAARTRSK